MTEELSFSKIYNWYRPDDVASVCGALSFGSTIIAGTIGMMPVIGGCGPIAFVYGAVAFISVPTVYISTLAISSVQYSAQYLFGSKKTAASNDES